MIDNLRSMWPDLDAVPGTVSVWCAPVGAAEPRYARAEHVPHYAASTMKIAVLVPAYRDDLAAGLPPGTHIAHKSGWVTGVRHGAGIVYPRDRPPYLLVVLSSTTLPDAAARTLLARIAAASWSVGAGRSGGQ